MNGYKHNKKACTCIHLCKSRRNRFIILFLNFVIPYYNIKVLNYNYFYNNYLFINRCTHLYITTINLYIHTTLENHLQHSLISGFFYLINFKKYTNS